MMVQVNLQRNLAKEAEKTGEVKGTDKTYVDLCESCKSEDGENGRSPNYGTGFTPYFLSLGLLVGMLLSIVYPLRDTVGVPKSGFSWLFVSSAYYYQLVLFKR